MISIVPTPESLSKVECPLVERAAETDERGDEFSIEVRRIEPVNGAFDLFAEARQIYARARSGGRVRSSHII